MVYSGICVVGICPAAKTKLRFGWYMHTLVRWYIWHVVLPLILNIQIYNMTYMYTYLERILLDSRLYSALTLWRYPRALYHYVKTEIWYVIKRIYSSRSWNCRSIGHSEMMYFSWYRWLVDPISCMKCGSISACSTLFNIQNMTYLRATTDSGVMMITFSHLLSSVFAS